METGILNFHDEETFSSSWYDRLDTIGSDQYSSDYLDVSDSHWGTEQELNGDIAVLPMDCPASHMRALHNKEDYNRAFDEWQEHLISLQPVGPEDMELHVDSHGFAADLHSTVFQDALSFTPEPMATAPTEPLVRLPRPPCLSPIPPSPPCHSPTPSPPPPSTVPTDSALLDDCFPESTNVETKHPRFDSPENINLSKPEPVVTDEELDESFLSLDISNIDEMALEELQCDIKGLANGDPVSCILGALEFDGENGGNLMLPEDNVGIAGCLREEGQLKLKTTNKIENLGQEDVILPDSTMILPETMTQLNIKDEPLTIDFDEIDIVIKDELNLEIDALDIDMDSLAEQMPVLEAGNLESLLEQFEASETGNTSETFVETVDEATIKEKMDETIGRGAHASVVTLQSNVSSSTQSLPLPTSQCVTKPVNVQSAVPVKAVTSVKPEAAPFVKQELAPPMKVKSPYATLVPTPSVKLKCTSSVKAKSARTIKTESIPSVELQPISSVEPKSIPHIQPKPEVVSFVQTKQRRDSKKLSTSKASTNSSQLHKDIRAALPPEVIDRIKACGRRKEVPIIPAIPKLKRGKSAGRPNNSAPKNQRKRADQKTDQIQMDHDYCGSKESSIAPVSTKFYNCDMSEYNTATVVRSPNSKTTLQITAKSVRRIPEYITVVGSNTKKDSKPGKSLLKSSADWYDKKSSRKDSGLSSGDVSDDSESAAHLSGSSSGCETGGSTNGSTTFGKVKLANTPGKPKNLLMVSVLKKASHLPVPAAVVRKESNVAPSVTSSVAPTVLPSVTPTVLPSVTPTVLPSVTPTVLPSVTPTVLPSVTPTVLPSVTPTVIPNASLVIPNASLVTPKVSIDSPIEPPMLPDRQSESEMDAEDESKPKRRKLNLEEYRNRQREIGRQRSETEKVACRDAVVVNNDFSVPALEPVTVVSESVAFETKRKDERLDADAVEKKQPSESNVQACAQTSPEESQMAQSQAMEKRRRQYRRRLSNSSSSDSTMCPEQSQKIISSNQESVQKWRRTEPQTKSGSRTRSKSQSGRKSRLKLRSSSVSSGSSSRSRSSSCSSCSSSSSSSSRGRSNSYVSSVSRRSRTYSRSSRRSSCNRYNSSRRRDRSRSRRRDRSRSRSRSHSRSRSRSWRRGRKYLRRGGRQSYSRSRSRSRSRSHSRWYSKRRRSISSQSQSSDSGRSQSRSRSRRYRRSRSRSVSWGGRGVGVGDGDGDGGSRPRSRNWRSRSPVSRNSSWQMKETERNREIEERRVVYVGRIPEETTKAELRRRFEAFGPIIDISLHFRERADNYGFVTFAYKADAYSAVERGNADPNLPRYDLCFGGRRKFCGERYSDLDGLACKHSDSYQSAPVRPAESKSFDLLLRQAQAKLRKKKL